MKGEKKRGGGCYRRLPQMWNCVKWHDCILYFFPPFHGNVSYCMIRSLRTNVCIQPVNITLHLSYGTRKTTDCCRLIV